VTEKTNQLAVLMLALEFMLSTSEPTRVVQDTIAKIRAKMTILHRNEPLLYETADALKDKNYKLAWNNTKGIEDAVDIRYVSLGSMILLLTDKLPKKYLNKFIGSKQLEKCIDSYMFSKSQDDKEFQMEFEANKLVKEYLSLLGYKPDVLLKRKLFTLKQNKIIEDG